ncbi:MAG: hypothetical protein A3G34_03345 [Candidatus Lindowbacteria bacterium RIFCSPLOWO2_12_FULL_62_27]|nr:MAG: hypothetical protein A3I06_16120 [Candidatus Lindowbacteria bacterium RIFCSPLOWO2_02_FULL_62_12]OGH62980.1 MAG: hypothetical protein A3G34_03345 [Candidatus Lindowbacteria bacterium RIFCSPLOWO2_12_FULL_62_27]
MPEDVLTRILASVRKRLQERKTKFPLRLITRWAAAIRPSDFARAVRGKTRLSIIAEIKRSSPSSPNLARGLDPVAMARTYHRAGAAALSVLTEQDHFAGSVRDLQNVARVVPLPVLRKDFIVDEYQIYEARAFGASAVLLIVRALRPAQLRRLLRLATWLKLAALVEVHDEQELETALAAGARIIGVNNRNLSTLKTDLAVALNLLPLVPRTCVAIAESGYSRPSDLVPLRGIADAVLIGTALLRDPLRIRRILRAARARPPKQASVSAR